MGQAQESLHCIQPPVNIYSQHSWTQYYYTETYVYNILTYVQHQPTGNYEKCVYVLKGIHKQEIF
jgi:hypothetical protein